MYRFDKTLQKDDVMIGHSLGQFSALVNAKSMSLMDGLKLVHKRGELMMKYTKEPHGMLIIKFQKDRESIVKEKIADLHLEIACINTSTSIIVAGLKNSIAELAKLLRSAHIGSIALPVSTAFHCKMLKQMEEEFRNELEKIDFETPFCKIIRNIDTEIYTDKVHIRDGLLKQLTNPVCFYQSIQKVNKQYELIEVGHKISISKFVEEIRSQMQ